MEYKNITAQYLRENVSRRHIDYILEKRKNYENSNENSLRKYSDGRLLMSTSELNKLLEETRKYSRKCPLCGKEMN